MPTTPVERAVQRRDAVRAGRLGPSLQVRLVELDDVGAGREQVLDLGVARVGVRHRHRLDVGVELVLRLLRHRERARHRDLDGPVGVGPQELGVPHLDRAGAG